MHPLDSLPGWLQINDKGECIQTTQIVRFKPCQEKGKERTHVTFLMSDGEDIHVPCQLLTQQLAANAFPKILAHILQRAGEETVEDENTRFHIPDDYEPFNMDDFLGHLAARQEPTSRGRREATPTPAGTPSAFPAGAVGS